VPVTVIPVAILGLLSNMFDFVVPVRL